MYKGVEKTFYTLESFMRKLVIFMLVFAVLGNNTAFAQTTGKGAGASSEAGSSGMAWGIALGTVAVVATVVIATTLAATTAPSSHSH